MGFVYIIFSHSKWCLFDGWVSFWGIISQGMIVIHELVSPGKPVLNQPGPNGMTEGNADHGWPFTESTLHTTRGSGGTCWICWSHVHVVGFSFHHQWELWDAMSWDSRVWTIDIGVNNTPGNGRWTPIVMLYFLWMKGQPAKNNNYGTIYGTYVSLAFDAIFSRDSFGGYSLPPD